MPSEGNPRSSYLVKNKYYASDTFRTGVTY